MKFNKYLVTGVNLPDRDVLRRVRRKGTQIAYRFRVKVSVFRPGNEVLFMPLNHGPEALKGLT